MVVSKHEGKSCYMWFSVVTTEEKNYMFKVTLFVSIFYANLFIANHFM